MFAGTRLRRMCAALNAVRAQPLAQGLHDRGTAELGHQLGVSVEVGEDDDLADLGVLVAAAGGRELTYRINRISLLASV